MLFVNFRLRDSRLGRAWIALREDEVAAVSMGVPSVKTKLLAYATGAAIGGISGAFLGSFLNTVNADQFQFSFSIFVLAMIILGGLGIDLGRGRRRDRAVVHQHLADPRRPQLVARASSGFDFDATQITFGIFGFLLVIMMILRPQGLMPERRHKMELTERRRRPATKPSTRHGHERD